MPERRADRVAADLVVLSPHYDDAALSCGGEIARRSAEGERVVVVTICAAPPPGTSGAGADPGPGPRPPRNRGSDAGPIDRSIAAGLSAFAAEHVARWRASAIGGPDGRAATADGSATHDGAPSHRAASDMVALRRAEDHAALRRLGAESIEMDVPDAIFRIAGGVHPYDTPESLFGPIDRRELDLVGRVHRDLASLPGIRPSAKVLAPLGFGGHVDHRLTRAAAEAWCAGTDLRLTYYADLPYAADAGLHAPGLIQDPLVPGRRLRLRLVALSDRHLATKTEAIACYGSQLSTFWTSEAEMVSDVRRWAGAETETGADRRTSGAPGRLGEWRADAVGGDRGLERVDGVTLGRDEARSPAAGRRERP